MTDTVYAQSDVAAAANTGRAGRLKAARAALIFIPLFALIVLVVAFMGMGKESQRLQDEAQPAAAESTVDAAVVQSAVDALPKDTDPAKKAKVADAVEKALADEAPQNEQQGGSALGGLMVTFIIVLFFVALFGSLHLLSRRQDPFPRIASMVLVPVLLFVGLLTTGMSVIALNYEPEEKKRPFNTLAVMADRARLDNVQLSVNTQGETRPRTEIDLVPQVSGKIVYVSPNFLEGGIFRRGETLVRIDPKDYEVAVISAEARLANAQQALTREIAEGQIARADYEELGRGTPSPLALREPQRQQAEAALTAARADLENARLQLTRTSVTAPFAGRVRSKTADVGQFVAPGTRLGRIFSTDIVEVRLPLTDADLAKIDLPIAFVAESREAAPKVTLSTTLQGERREWEGRIMRTDASYDTQTRALFAIAEVVDPYGAGATDGVPLAPGLFVDARIDGRSLDNVIVLPRDGLRPRNEVYVVDDTGKAEIREASVIDTSPDRAVLRPGVIREGEIVVVSPMERSRIETPLKVLDVNDPSNVIVEPPSRGGPPAGG